MGIGDRLLDPTYQPTGGQQPAITEAPYFVKTIKCPVKFTDDIIKYCEDSDYLDTQLRPLPPRTA